MAIEFRKTTLFQRPKPRYRHKPFEPGQHKRVFARHDRAYIIASRTHGRSEVSWPELRKHHRQFNPEF
jgi:hypothetical protein